MIIHCADRHIRSSTVRPLRCDVAKREAVGDLFRAKVCFAEQALRYSMGLIAALLGLSCQEFTRRVRATVTAKVLSFFYNLCICISQNSIICIK